MAQVLTTIAAALAICGGLYQLIGSIERHVANTAANTKAVLELIQAVDDLTSRVDALERGMRLPHRPHPRLAGAR